MPMTRKNRRSSNVTRKKSSTRGRTRRATRLSPGVKKAVTQLIHSNEESKYVAQVSYQSTFVPLTTNPVRSLVPLCYQGSGDSQHEGDVIKPTVLRSHFHFYYPKQMETTFDTTVILYVLTSKKIKNMTDLIASGAEANLILKDGTGGDPVAFTNASALQCAMMPVDTNLYSVLAKKTFRLIRNQGHENYDNTIDNASNLGKSAANYTFIHKRVPTLKFKGNGAEAQNYAPFYYAVQYHTNGEPMSQPVVAFDVRNEMFYKDS